MIKIFTVYLVGIFHAGSDPYTLLYYNSNLIRQIVSLQVDEVIPSDPPRREASSVIQWYGLIHEM